MNENQIPTTKFTGNWLPLGVILKAMQLVEGETVYLNIDSATLLLYGWLPSFSLVWGKRIIVTSKRIILSFSWFGYESFRGGISYFYNEHEYKLCREPRSSFIKRHTTGRFIREYIKLTSSGSLINPRVVIFTSHNKRIEDIISEANWKKYKIFSQRKEVVDSASWFRDTPHYWAKDSLPLAYAMACVEVVSQMSEKAGAIYLKI